MGYVTANAQQCVDPFNFTALTPHQRRGSDAAGLSKYCYSAFLHSNRTSYFDLFPFSNGREIWGSTLLVHELEWLGDRYVGDLLVSFENQYHDLLRFYFGAYHQTHTDYYIDQARLDDEVANMLETIDLGNSIVVLFGDHGIHYGKPVSVHCCFAASSLHRFSVTIMSCFVSCSLSGLHTLSRQGQIDNKWPFLLMSVPHRVLDRFPLLGRNLQANQLRLTSPYDLHATLRHFLFYPFFPPSPTLNPFGRSLLDPVPQNRTCSEAGIWYRYCACLPWDDVDHSAPLYQSVVNASLHVFHSCVAIPLSRSRFSRCKHPDRVSVESISLFAHPPDSWQEKLVRSRTNVFIGNRVITWDLVFALFPVRIEEEVPIEHGDSSCLHWTNQELRLVETSRITNMIPSELLHSDNKIFTSHTFCMK